MLELGIFWGLCALWYVFLKFFVSSFKKKAGPSLSFLEAPYRLHFDAARRTSFDYCVLSYSATWVLKELEMGQKAASLIVLARDVIAVFLAATGFFRWKKMFYDSLLSRRGKAGFDPASLSLLSKLFTLFTGMIASLTVLHILGMDIVPLITFGGIGAAAMAFASIDVVANFFSGLMLHIARPFTIGDQVELPGKKIGGRVEEIGWCSTALRDKQKRPIYLPNSLFASEALSTARKESIARSKRLFVSV